MSAQHRRPLGLIATGAFMFLAASTVYAESGQSAGANVGLTGVINSILSISFTAGANNYSLDLGGEGVDEPEQIVQVADLTVSTNNVEGYTLTVDSLNNGLLDNDGAHTLGYEMLLVNDGTPVSAGSSGWTSASGIFTESNANLQAYNRALDLHIKYDPGQFQDPGTYSDIAIVTITDL